MLGRSLGLSSVMSRLLLPYGKLVTWFGSKRDTRWFRLLIAIKGWWPISWLGLVSVTASSLMLYYQALATQDLLALGIAVSIIGLTAISACLTLIQSWLVRYSVRSNASIGEPLRCETGITTATGFEPTFWLMPWVHVSWNWSAPASEVLLHDTSSKHEYCWFWKRGQREQVTRNFQVTDWLGLSKVGFPINSSTSVVILPHYGHLTTIEPLRRPTPGEDLSDPRGAPMGDRIDMRQYVKGDSPRNIMWKIYARTRRLMVRIPERAVSIQPKICLYLHCNEHDEAAAATARLLIEQGTVGQNWLFASNGFSGHRTQSQQALLAIAQSGDVAATSSSGTQLATFLAEAGQAGFTQCLLVLPARLNQQESQQLLEACSNRVMPIFPLISCDRSLHSPKFGTGNFLKRWIWQEPSHSQVSVEGLEVLAQRWKNHPDPVMWLERNTGQYLTDIRFFQSRGVPQ